MLRSFQVYMYECAGLASELDVVQTLELIRPLGLALAVGAWKFAENPSPAKDIAATLKEGYWPWQRWRPEAQSPPRNPLRPVEQWMRGLLRVDQPTTFSGVDVTHRAGGAWDMFFNITPSAYQKTGLTLEQFATGWGDLLDQMGPVLYTRLRPALGLILGAGEDIPDLLRPAVERRLCVGWRTWFGPAYVERHGREWLRGLPDRTGDLDDGGVWQALDAPAVDLVKGEGIYGPLRAYIDEAGIVPAWPRKRGGGSPAAAKSRALGQFASYVTELLATTIVLKDGRRIKMLPLGWKDLQAPQRALALDRVRLVLEAELKAHPQSRIELEVDALASPLQRLLDALVSQASGRFSYRIVPDLVPDREANN